MKPKTYYAKAYKYPEEVKEAYGILKRWDSLTPKDESLFLEKKIELVNILFDRKTEMPSHAWTRYMIGDDVCVKGLELKRSDELSDKVRD